MMKLFCLGDSLTYGYDVAYDKRWTTILACRAGISVCNEGICGDTTQGMAYRLRRRDISAFDAFFFMGGSNDILLDVPLREIKRYVTEIAAMLEREQKPVYAGVPILTTADSAAFGWQRACDVEKHNDVLREYRQFLLRLAGERKFIPVDFYEALRKYEEDGAAPVYADGVHPNELGYAVMAQTATAALLAAAKESI